MHGKWRVRRLSRPIASLPQGKAQIEHLWCLQASVMWPNHFLLILMDCCLKGSCGTCQVMLLQTGFLHALHLLWVGGSCSFCQPLQWSPSTGSRTFQITFQQLFSSSERFSSVKISIPKDVLLSFSWKEENTPCAPHTFIIFLRSMTAVSSHTTELELLGSFLV